MVPLTNMVPEVTSVENASKASIEEVHEAPLHNPEVVFIADSKVAS